MFIHPKKVIISFKGIVIVFNGLNSYFCRNNNNTFSKGWKILTGKTYHFLI